MGPIIRAEVGDRVVVHLRNKLDFTVNFEPQGLLASKDVYKVVAEPNATAVYTFGAPEQVPFVCAAFFTEITCAQPAPLDLKVQCALQVLFKFIVLDRFCHIPYQTQNKGCLAYIALAISSPLYLHHQCGSSSCFFHVKSFGPCINL